jgi:hypothetical protein
MKLILNSHNYSHYLQVIEVLEIKDNCISKTKLLPLFVHRNDELLFDRKKYFTCPISNAYLDQIKSTGIEVEIVQFTRNYYGAEFKTSC